MTTLRMLLAMCGGGSAAYAVVALIPPFGLTIHDFGVGVAITAFCVVSNGAIRAAQSYHPSNRRTP